MQDQAANMTKKNVDFINKKLQKESPASLIKILETFVAMLRNTNKADMVDVEIYFKEYSKLAKKLQTITAVKHDIDTVTMHEKAIEQQKSAFNAEYKDLTFICDYGLAFCKYAKQFCEQASTGSDLTEVEKNLASAQEDVANYSKMEEAGGSKGDIAAFIKKMIENQKER